jgi:hypothetical protein
MLTTNGELTSHKLGILPVLADNLAFGTDKTWRVLEASSVDNPALSHDLSI